MYFFVVIKRHISKSRCILFLMSNSPLQVKQVFEPHLQRHAVGIRLRKHFHNDSWIVPVLIPIHLLHHLCRSRRLRIQPDHFCSGGVRLQFVVDERALAKVLAGTLVAQPRLHRVLVRRQNVALQVWFFEVVVGAVLAAIGPVAQVPPGVLLQSCKMGIMYWY